MKTGTAVLYLSLVLLLASVATAQATKASTNFPCGPAISPSPTLVVNWPQFHFDAAHTGCNPYESLLGPDTVGNLTLMWRYTTGGEVESPPSVANGIVYVGSDDDYIYAVNASTGALVWKYYTGFAALDAPVVANGMVYAFSYVPYGGAVALNANTGELIWQENAEGTGYGASLTLDKGVLYTASSRRVFALDAGTGYEIWESQDDIGVDDNSAPAVANGLVYVGSTDGNLYALNASTGQTVWSYPAGEINSSPAVANGLVYVSAGSMYALDASTGALVWSYPTFGIYCGNSRDCGPSVANGIVYALDFGAGFYALDANTGALVWDYPLSGASSPDIANGVAYVGSEDGTVNAINVNTGKLLWHYPTALQVWSSPAVANGMVYVGSNDGNLYAFHLPGH